MKPGAGYPRPAGRARGRLALRALALAALAVTLLHRPVRAGADTTLALPGLRSPVRIVTDRNGIPHVRASCLSDLYCAWGFVTARDRMWQLEYSRRAGQGRLWEWFGNRALRGDGGAQLFEFADRAARVWERERLDPGTRVALERFADGVNAYLRLCRNGTVPWAPEFVRLGHRPEDWRPQDAALLLYGMGVLLDLDIPELAEAETLRVHGDGWYNRRRRFESGWVYRSIPDSAAARLYGGPAPPRTPGGPTRGGTHVGWRMPGIPAGRDPGQQASNIFAVGPGRSDRHAALLANDVHLSLASPPPFHIIHVTVPDTVDAAGACVPGLPIIVSGRNRRCAWGITALSGDVIDVYADTLSTDGRRVRSRGGWVPVREADYTMRFRFLGIPLPPLGQKRRYTPHGPVIALDDKKHIALSARWTALEATMTLRDLIGLERSTSVGELARRARTLITPTLNLVAADISGRVRYQTAGALPRRPFVAGRGVLPADGAHEWSGMIPPDSMPAWDVPARGFIVNANNLPAGAAYPEALPRYDWVHDRAARMAERLQGDGRITLTDIRSVQNDTYSRAAARLVPRLLACADSVAGRLSPLERTVLDTLRAWDFRAYRGRVAPTIYRAWLGAFNRRTGLGDVPGLTLAALDGRAPEALRAPGGAAPERAAIAAAASLDTAVTALARLLGPDPASWTWGRAHRARFRHSLSWLEPKFQPATIAMDGDNSSPSVGPSRLPGDVTVIHGPAWRHIVDLADPDVSWCVIPPGNATGSHALDHLRRWASHGYVPLHLSWERVEALKESDVRLVPADSGR